MHTVCKTQLTIQFQETRGPCGSVSLVAGIRNAHFQSCNTHTHSGAFIRASHTQAAQGPGSFLAQTLLRVAYHDNAWPAPHAHSRCTSYNAWSDNSLASPLYDQGRTDASLSMIVYILVAASGWPQVGERMEWKQLMRGSVWAQWRMQWLSRTPVVTMTRPADKVSLAACVSQRVPTHRYRNNWIRQVGSKL